MLMTLKLPTLLYGATWAGLIVLMVIVPIILVLLFVMGTLQLTDLRWAYPQFVEIGDTSQGQGALALAIGLIPWGAVAFAGWHLQALFQLFRDDQALTYAAATRIRKVGLWLVVAAVSKPIVGALQTLVLTFSNAPGERAIAVGFSFAEFGFLIAGGLMVVIGRALVDATKAVEEARGFV